MALGRAFVVSCLVGFGLYFGLKRSSWEAGLASLIGFFVLGGLGPTLLILKTLPRDIKYIGFILKVGARINSHRSNGDTVSSIFDKTASRHPKKTAIIFEDQTWTFEDVDRYSNKIANMFHSMGFNRGDSVAIFMMNRPEHTCIFLGLCKIGVKVSMINYNLTEQSLLHCIEVTKIKGFIYEESLESSVSWLYQRMNETMQNNTFCIRGEKTSSIGRHLESEMKDFPDTAPPLLTGIKTEDCFCYIYSSGTTGVPKMIPNMHSRFFALPLGYGCATNLNDDDILYICLPLYFAIGTFSAMGQMICFGRTVVLSRKFSVQNFWKECIKHKCTAVFYVGELLRFLLSVPPDPSDASNCIRIAIGNGLRKNAIIEFKRRFKVPEIVEVYGTSEYSFGLMNIGGKLGAMGYKPKIFQFLFPMYVVKADPTTGEPIRNRNGHCTCASVGEPGLLVFIINKNFKFFGYTNSDEATKKKILHNVFKDGDTYFNSGDMVKMDDEGYLYFIDRAVDMFQCRGENVSTTEVENVISSILNLCFVIVVGVQIPNNEDRAGMAIIQSSDKEVNVSQLATELSSLLPSYAMPLFLRFVDTVDLTGTFKFQKTRYRKEGYDPKLTGGDAIYVLNKEDMSYIPFDEEQHQKILNGTIEF